MVLGQKAYILFYIKSPVNGRSASAPPPPRSDVAQATASQADVPVRACNSVPQPRRPASAAPVSDEKGSERPSVKRKLSSAFPALDAAAQERMAAAKEAGTPQAPQVPAFTIKKFFTLKQVAPAAAARCFDPCRAGLTQMSWL